MTPAAADTIAAVATAPGVAGVAIVRLSGPDALAIADRLLPPSHPATGRPPNTFFLARLSHPATRVEIDHALVLIFHAPHSYTGETTVEFQCHGGAQPPALLLHALLDAGARLAAPGEFTRRAFLNGRLDLTQAEAVLDLLNARTERAAHAAAEQLNGRLRTSFDALYDTLLDCAAQLEHQLDFEENELPPDALASLAATLRKELAAARETTAAHLATFHEGHLLRDGAAVVIAGPPNAGKSSLLNALLGRDRAIVTPAAGTTRDTLEESFNLRGIPVRLVDTAGLRDTDCHIEALGIGRTRDAIRGADAVLYVLDATQPFSQTERGSIEALPQDRTLLLFNKTDLPASEPPCNLFPKPRTFQISALQPATLRPMLDALAGLLLQSGSSETTGPCISARHRQALADVQNHITQALTLLDDPALGWVIAATSLRQAADAVAELTGKSYSDDLLDRIFGCFCVGK